VKRRPNLFIVGAPKCGTTALSEWLAEHPDVYFSSEKEPHHFYCPHAPRMSRKDYEALFAEVRDERIIAEGSVWYLYSRQALERIYRFNPDARIVICLRNPVDMVISLHSHWLSGGRETVASFEEAWRFRSLDGDVPPEGVPPENFAPVAYELAGQLGTQLARAYEIFPKEQVHTILLDDVRRDPKASWSALLNFLDIAQDGRQDFPVVNSAKAAKNTRLQQILHFVRMQKWKLRIPLNLGVLTAVHNWNLYERPNSVPTSVRHMLTEAFLGEMRLMEDLLQRDLSAWYADQAPAQKLAS
jgi:sulfotransferase family protein